MEPRGFEPLTSAVQSRGRLLAVVRHCVWRERVFALYEPNTLNLVRGCVWLLAGGFWPRWCSDWCSVGGPAFWLNGARVTDTSWRAAAGWWRSYSLGVKRKRAPR